MGRHLKTPCDCNRNAVLVELDDEDTSLVAPGLLQTKILPIKPFRSIKNSNVKNRKSITTRTKPTLLLDQTSAAMALLSFRLETRLVFEGEYSPRSEGCLDMKKMVDPSDESAYCCRNPSKACSSSLPPGKPIGVAPKLAKHLHLVTKPIDLSLQ